jgi:hypothetical protein
LRPARRGAPATRLRRGPGSLSLPGPRHSDVNHRITSHSLDDSTEAICPQRRGQQQGPALDRAGPTHDTGHGGVISQGFPLRVPERWQPIRDFLLCSSLQYGDSLDAVPFINRGTHYHDGRSTCVRDHALPVLRNAPRRFTIPLITRTVCGGPTCR